MTSTAVADRRRAAQLFHALSDETRLAVIELLQSGERCVCELQDALDVAQSRLSFHLRVLKDAGFLVDRKEGRWVYYALDRDAFDDVQAAATELKPSRRALPLRRASSACCD